MTDTLFRIDYMDDAGTITHTETVALLDHWAACEHGWSHMPKGLEEFQVTELSDHTAN